MLIAKILDSQASLNNFHHVGAVQFLPGDTFSINFRMYDPQTKERFVPPSTAIVTLTFNIADVSTLDKVASFISPDDRSMNVVQLLAADTADMLGGNIRFKVDLLGDGTQILNGLIYNGLQKLYLDDSGENTWES